MSVIILSSGNMTSCRLQTAVHTAPQRLVGRLTRCHQGDTTHTRHVAAHNSGNHSHRSDLNCYQSTNKLILVM